MSGEDLLEGWVGFHRKSAGKVEETIKAGLVREGGGCEWDPTIKTIQEEQAFMQYKFERWNFPPLNRI